MAPKSATHLSRGWCAAGVAGPASMALSSTLPVVRSTTPASRSRRRRVVGGSAFPVASKTKRIRTRSSLPTSKCSRVQKHKPKLIYSRHCKSNRLLCSMRKGATCENFQILDSRLHLRPDFLQCPRARCFLPCQLSHRIRHHYPRPYRQSLLRRQWWSRRGKDS